MAEGLVHFNKTADVKFGDCLLTTYIDQAPPIEIMLTTTVKLAVSPVIAIVAIINNFLFIRAYTKFEVLHRIPYRLLVFLASSDFLVGVLAVPLYVARGVMELHGAHNCALFNIERFSINFLSPLSFFLLLLISCERFVAIIYPMKYPFMCTSRRTTFWFIVTLFMCLLFLLILVWNMNLYYIVVGIPVCLTVILILIIYCKIYRAAADQRNRIFTLQASSNTTTDDRETADVAVRDPDLVERKAEKTIAYILGFMLVCYAPALVFVFYAPCFEMLVFFNASCNPFIYCWRIRQIRKSVLSLLPLSCCKRPPRG